MKLRLKYEVGVWLKEKTFDEVGELNVFTGAMDFENRPVSVEIGYWLKEKYKHLFKWDDGSDMLVTEWVDLVKSIMIGGDYLYVKYELL